MFKLLKTCIFCLLAAFLVWFGTVLADRQALNDNVIRFHVVANSDSEEDQAVNKQIHSDRLVDRLSQTHRIRYYPVPGRGHCDLTEEMWQKYHQCAVDAIMK